MNRALSKTCESCKKQYAPLSNAQRRCLCCRQQICAGCSTRFVGKRYSSSIRSHAFCSSECFYKNRGRFHQSWNKGKHLHYKVWNDGKKLPGGSAHPTWKGGRYKTQGYVYVYVPDHPRIQKRPYVFEHILVAESKLKRYLKHGEVVHHINRIRDDNRPENLEVMTRAEHAMHHDPRGWRHVH